MHIDKLVPSRSAIIAAVAVRFLLEEPACACLTLGNPGWCLVWIMVHGSNLPDSRITRRSTGVIGPHVSQASWEQVKRMALFRI